MNKFLTLILAILMIGSMAQAMETTTLPKVYVNAARSFIENLFPEGQGHATIPKFLSQYLLARIDMAQKILGAKANSLTINNEVETLDYQNIRKISSPDLENRVVRMQYHFTKTVKALLSEHDQKYDDVTTLILTSKTLAETILGTIPILRPQMPELMLAHERETNDQ